ncbi:MAG: hypothetical protein ACK5NB_06300 [Flavobacteriaceae bacterium]
MMSTTRYKPFLFLVLLPFITFASTQTKDKYAKTKTINKVFSANANTVLKVDNSYGNIDIVTWNQNKITIDITITTSGNDEEKVMDKLNEIEVEFLATPNLVSAKTIFNKSKSNSWWIWGNRNNVNMKINYIIKMPVTGTIDLNNDYGNINVGKLEGPAKINCDYGKITTKELMADGNSLNFDYTQGCYFEYIKSGKINADYSSFTVSKTKNLEVEADYTNSTIEIAENLNFNCDYGSIKIEKANAINGAGDYLTTIIGEVYKLVNLKADYGSIKINQVAGTANAVNIQSDYVGIKIGYAPNFNFNFEINLDYAGLNTEGDLHFTKKHTEMTSKYYKGYYGNESTGNTLKIDSDYGSVTLFKN